MKTQDGLLTFSARLIHCVGAGLLGLMICAFGLSAQPVTLVADGAARLPLLAGSVPDAATELQTYLARISGARLEMAEPHRGAQGIYVGLTSDFPWLRESGSSELGHEGFILKSDGTNLLLLARHPLGVRHAVATFLHSLGCRWFFPGKVWEVVPRRSSIAGSWDRRDRPDFEVQRRIWYGFGAYATGRKDLEAWLRHNRMGGATPVSIGHTTHGLDPKLDFEKHPEWFALVDGKRSPSKPCYRHPAVRRRAIQQALVQAEGGAPMISMTPPDGLGYCECERCFDVFDGATPYEQHRTFFARRPDGTVVNVTSETLFHFINEVAAAVANVHPRTLVGCYAYSAYSHPPSFKLHPNVFVQTTTAFRRTDLSLEEQMDAWSARAAQLGIRDYYSVYQWDWDLPVPGKMTPGRLEAELRRYRRWGVTSINAEASNNWAARGLGYYLAARWMWDTKADRRAMLGDFYEKAFGPAARVMERYYVRWNGISAAVSAPRTASLADALRDPPLDAIGGGNNEEGASQFSLKSLKASFRDLSEAADLVRDQPAYRDRVNQLRMYWHYLLLRQRVEEAGSGGSDEEILRAIEAELTFAGRLASLNVIHARPLLGKALFRRFKRFEPLLKNQPSLKEPGQGWRRIGEAPGPQELERLWQGDLLALGLLNLRPEGE